MSGKEPLQLFNKHLYAVKLMRNERNFAGKAVSRSKYSNAVNDFNKMILNYFELNKNN